MSDDTSTTPVDGADLATVAAERDTLREQVAALTSERDQLASTHQLVLGRYRDKLVSDLPEAARALVAGESVEALDAARAKADELIVVLRGPAGTSTPGIPTGGTTRQPPNTDAMSATEKILYGLATRGA